MDDLEQAVRDAYARVNAVTPHEAPAFESIALRARRPSRRRWLAAAVAAAVLLVAGGAALMTGHDDRSIPVRTGDGPPEPPATTPRPSTGALQQLVVVSGSNPDDNDALVESFVSILESPGFRTELASATGVSFDQIDLTACRPPASAIVRVTVWHTDPDIAMLLAKHVTPAFRSLIEADQRSLPVEQRIPGPIVQDLYQQPVAINHTSESNCD
jgi:hypothetical protein